MSATHQGGNAQPTIDREEHRSVNGVNAKAVVPYGFDGANVMPQDAPAQATKITVVGAVTYIAHATPGTAQSTATWRARKIDQTSDTVITWADSGNYSQVATDLSALTYT